MKFMQVLNYFKRKKKMGTCQSSDVDPNQTKQKSPTDLPQISNVPESHGDISKPLNEATNMNAVALQSESQLVSNDADVNESLAHREFRNKIISLKTKLQDQVDNENFDSNTKSESVNADVDSSVKSLEDNEIDNNFSDVNKSNNNNNNTVGYITYDNSNMSRFSTNYDNNTKNINSANLVNGTLLYSASIRKVIVIYLLIICTPIFFVSPTFLKRHLT